MNKNYLHKSLPPLLLAAALTGCAKDKEEFHYIDLSQVACTFPGRGDNQPLTVSVITAPAAWSAAPTPPGNGRSGQDGRA